MEEKVYLNHPTPKIWCAGSKKSLRVWFDRFTRVFKEDGLNKCQSCHTMFVKHSIKETPTLFIDYVDDIVITRNDYDQIDNIN